MSDTIIKMTGGVIRQQKNTILKDVNVEIKSGEFIYLIGKVGSGKSSFLKTLYAELPLDYGTGEVAGFQLKKIKKSQIPLLRRKCGIVFQDFKLLIDRNVYANLEFVLRATGWINKKAIRERIETVLAKVDMTEKQNKMPHQLSGGEQQRIVLARALLNAPPIILADEPTGNIDPETSYRLIELLKEICDTGKTIIIATHQYDLIEKYPGRVLCCSNGELFEKCTPETSQAIITEVTADPTEILEETPSMEEPACIAGVVDIVEEITTGNAPEETDSLLEPLVFPEVESFDYEVETLQEIIATEEEEENTVSKADVPNSEPAPAAVTEQPEAMIDIPETTEEEPDEITDHSETMEKPEENDPKEVAAEEVATEEQVLIQESQEDQKKESTPLPKSPTFDLELD